MNPNRGSFPKVAHPETLEEKRARYEQWLIATKVAGVVDPELDAVLAQSNRTGGRRSSLKDAVRARCWQCVGGDEDEGGSVRIRECASSDCSLWSVRPYKMKDEPLPAPREGEISEGDHYGRAMASPGVRAIAIRAYCYQCQGGQRETNTMRMVTDCPAVTCATWFVRPKLKPIGQGPDVNPLQKTDEHEQGETEVQT